MGYRARLSMVARKEENLNQSNRRIIPGLRTQIERLNNTCKRNLPTWTMDLVASRKPMTGVNICSARVGYGHAAQYIEYGFAQLYGVKGDELEAAKAAIKSARRIIGTKSNGSNNDVEMDTMCDPSCVPAIILLKGALNHYRLRPVYFHPQKDKDALLAIHQRAYMSQTIRLLITSLRGTSLKGSTQNKAKSALVTQEPKY